MSALAIDAADQLAGLAEADDSLGAMFGEDEIEQADDSRGLAPLSGLGFMSARVQWDRRAGFNTTNPGHQTIRFQRSAANFRRRYESAKNAALKAGITP